MITPRSHPSLTWHLHICPLCGVCNRDAACQDLDAAGEHDCEPHQWFIDRETAGADAAIGG